MNKRKPHPELARLGRGLVQAGFLLLFLFPLFFVIYQKVTLRPAPVLTSWLLPWDPGLLLAQILRRDWVGIVFGAPLLLLALALVLGRSFCGWMCPMGALLDGVRGLVFWRKPKTLGSKPGLFPGNRNRNLRFFLLAFVLGASLVSLKFLGLFDPLVIFQRAGVTLADNYFLARQPGLRALIGMVSLLFFGILALEMWQPRFWCRNLCPLGALVSLISRFSLLKRQVSPSLCNQCQQCRRDCPMNAIPKDALRTDYSQCTFCLECASACTKGGISFGFSRRLPRPSRESLAVSPSSRASGASRLTRRQFIGAVAVAGAGAGMAPLVGLAPNQPVLRPPGALPEAEFLRTCILCQECIRACPTGALHPSLLESGLEGLGTPVLVPRLGACALNPSCPDLCASVCPVGAILPTTREALKIGLAVVHREACLAWDQGARCLVCVEACLNQAAIPFNGRVTVDPNRCTGCGRCESGCPVPGSAIRVEPVRNQSSRG